MNQVLPRKLLIVLALLSVFGCESKEERCFREADSGDTGAMIELAEIFRDQGSDEQAIEMLDRALAAGDSHAVTPIKYYADKDNDLALFSLTRYYIKHDPQLAGDAAIRLMNIDLASSWYIGAMLVFNEEHQKLKKSREAALQCMLAERIRFPSRFLEPLLLQLIEDGLLDAPSDQVVKKWQEKASQMEESQFKNLVSFLRGYCRNHPQLVSYTAQIEKQGTPVQSVEKVTKDATIVGYQRGQIDNQEMTSIGDTYINSLGMKFVFIPAGQFVMGSPYNEEHSGSDELQHKVRISHAFMMGITEVTQHHYEKIMGHNPSYNKGHKKPVERVSWEDAIAFCQKISRQEGKHYRLPTEVEWEYACRAGSTAKYSFGASDDDMKFYGWYSQNSNHKTQSVGLLKPNRWGLYDMHGNVSEWCSDWYDPDYSLEEITTSPQGPNKGTDRVCRGGSYGGTLTYCRSAYRSFSPPEEKWEYIGFRIVLELVGG